MKNDHQWNEKQLQFQFDLEIQKVKLLNPISIPKSSYLEIIWRRGQKNISTKIKPEIKGSEEQIFFGETLSMISTCGLNADTHQFGEKESIVSAVIYISGAQKLFGSVTINLNEVLDPKNFYQRSVKYIEKQLNGRAKSKIFLKLTSNYLKQKVKGDEMSIGSGVNSNSYNNTSSYSIERRLVDIPSKDTYSVLSYGGGVRYSAKKEDAGSIRRQQSTKKIEQQSVKQYGRYGTYATTATNFYSKPSNEYNLTPLPPTVTQPLPSTQPTILSSQPTTTSNIKSISSIQSSANRLPRNSADNQHNRSSVGEQSSRLLIEEQTRRSKLEAEATKSRVENEELKNKLSEYVRENMRLKEEAKKFYENSDSRQAEIKKENEQLKERNYVLMNQVRQLKTRFDKYIGLQKQCQILRTERDTIQKQHKASEDTISFIRRELEQNQSTLSRVKDSESKLMQELKEQGIRNNRAEAEEAKRKELEAKVKDVHGQLEYYQNNCKNLSALLREAEEKFRNAQRDNKNLENRIENTRNQEIRKYNDLAYSKDREIKELNQKLNAKSQQCTRYILEAQKFKNDYSKIKDQKIAQLENTKNQLTIQIERVSSSLRDANARSQQLQQQKNSLNAQIRAQIVMRSKQTDRVRQAEDNLTQLQRKYQKQTSDLRKNLQQLQMQNVQLNNLLSQKSKSLQQAQSNHEQLQSLMKQNLQLQLQLKYKIEQSQRHHNMAEQHQNLKFKHSLQENNLRQLNTQVERWQKQSRDKNRSYLMECEKTRMLNQQRTNTQKAFNQVKEELQRAREVIANGEKQFEEMRACIDDLEGRNIGLLQDMRRLEDKLAQQNPDKHVAQLKALQARNRQLQNRDSQKIKSIQNLSRNLATSNSEIKQLQTISEQRLQQTLTHQFTIDQLSHKIQDLEQSLTQVTRDLNIAIQDKKSIVKKNQMIMEELFSHKKRLEEEKEKGRVLSHTSTIQVRSSEDYIKMKNMENQLQKRDEKIRKMEKEIINLQNQNVNLSIQVMKKLEDITPK